jgi:hypothetical protein
MSVSPPIIDFGPVTPERSIRITNDGNRDFKYSVNHLLDSFVPEPPSGTVLTGESVTVSIIRTTKPPQRSVFSVDDNFNDSSSVEITIRDEYSNSPQYPYNKLADEASARALIGDLASPMSWPW